jgi:hypothetical protein
MNKHLASLIALFITWSGSAMAQEVASADVNIVSVQAEMTKGDQFVCTAVINNQNDDDSRGTKVVVLLPLQVTITEMSVLRGPSTCRKSQPSGGFKGYAICDLGSLPQGPTVRRTIKITTTKSTAGPNYPQACGAFIFSRIGDIEKNNNYMAATVSQ